MGEEVSPDFIYSGLVYLTIAMVGGCLGSFASAVAYRIRHGESWIKDPFDVSGKVVPARSRCPRCGHQLSWLDLIPVLSWIFILHGRCRYCHERVAVRYPLVELAGSLLLALFYAMGGGPLLLIAFSVTLPFALACGLLLVDKVRPPLYVIILTGFLVLFFILAFFKGGGFEIS